MDVIILLEYLQEIVETASKLPMTGKVMVDKKEVLETLEKIMHTLPDEFKKAQWVCDEKERILKEAQYEAEVRKQENLDFFKRQIETHDLTREARIRAEEIIASAQRDAKAIRLGARDYADEILSQLEKEVNTQGKQMLESIQKLLQEFAYSLGDNVEAASNTIRNNIKELRNMK